ncbi:MAG: tol-pal system YbgF family protein, partial [Bradymonadaceae bacterium]
DIQQALREYERIWSEPIDDSAGARAMYEASRLVGRKRGRPEKARAMRRRLMDRYPESAWAERSVEALLDHHAERDDWEALCRNLDALYDELRKTPLADH